MEKHEILINESVCLGRAVRTDDLSVHEGLIIACADFRDEQLGYAADGEAPLYGRRYWGGSESGGIWTVIVVAGDDAIYMFDNLN